MPKLYLSPSMQTANVCAAGDREANHCNEVCDILEEYLGACGITYKRNRELTALSDIAADSNAYAPDLHLAVHTNASNGKVRGHHVYYYPTSPNGRRMAEILLREHDGIYRVEGAQREAIGNSAYTELKRTGAIAVIEETVFHDNDEDAAWYHENTRAVARYLAKSVCSYFGVPFVEPTDWRAKYDALRGEMQRIYDIAAEALKE